MAQAFLKKNLEISSLPKRADFLLMNAKADKWISKSLILQIRPHGADESIETSTRVGFTVTKRVSKSAVVRNRIKRRLREAARDIIATHAKQGYDYVIIARPQTLERNYTHIRQDLRWCLKKLDLYMPHAPQ